MSESVHALTLPATLAELAEYVTEAIEQNDEDMLVGFRFLPGVETEGLGLVQGLQLSVHDPQQEQN